MTSSGVKWLYVLIVIPVDSELVRRKRASLVGAQDGHSGQLLDGGDTRDDSFVLRQLCGPDRKSHRKDSRHSDGDPSDEEHQNVVQPTTVLEPEPSIENENFSDDEDADGDETEGADLSKNLLQVACSVVILAHERGCATEESVGTSGNDNAFSFALLASGPAKFKVSHLRLHADSRHSRETLIAGFLVLGKRLARQSSLVNGDVDRLDKSTVRGTMSPILKEIMSPGTRMDDSTSCHAPSRRTLALGASASMSALTASPAFCSS